MSSVEDPSVKPIKELEDWSKMAIFYSKFPNLLTMNNLPEDEDLIEPEDAGTGHLLFLSFTQITGLELILVRALREEDWIPDVELNKKVCLWCGDITRLVCKISNFIHVLTLQGC